MAELPDPFLFRLLWWVEHLGVCSESLGSEKVSYGPCAHQESCESLAAMAKFLVIRFDRRAWAPPQEDWFMSLESSYSSEIFMFPKDPWTLLWRGWNLYSRGPDPQNRHFWGVRILRVRYKCISDFCCMLHHTSQYRTCIHGCFQK